ncbi:low-temperature-induced 65 kDa protein-like [Euphorbia lathyris]|uniref:low-temperature-induced 65 kDa protein-like n=1 Tax=Euphorbia lathyris TaxID=212925 RepID=UPI003314374B
MNSQIVRPHDHSYEHHAVGEDENEHHHEKKSVLKKVKAKAKKIKDTLKSHGQGHHDHDDHLVHDTPDDHDLDEDDDEDEDEEMANDPEIHGASGLDSTAVRSYGRSSAAMEDEEASPGYSDKTQSTEEGQGNKVRLERTDNVIIKDAPFTPQSLNPIETYSIEEETIRGKPQIGIKNSERFEEDPDAPKSIPQHQIPTNYQTKVTDPTGEGTKEIEASSILHKMGHMDISQESKPEAGEVHFIRHDQSILPTGSHDQFSPEPTPPMPVVSEEDHPAEKGPQQSSYTQKISSATSAIADKAIYAKNVVASKLGYGAREDAKGHEEQEKSKESAASPVQYGKKIATTVTEKLTPVYEKVAETGSNLMSKAQGTGSNTEEQDTGKKLGKVTESEEVKKRLGSFEENTEESGVDTAGSGVVSKVKEVVGSFLGKGEENRSSSQDSLGSEGGDGFPGSLNEEETRGKRV